MTTALLAAIARSRETDVRPDIVQSPLRELGRRRLGRVDLLGQSLSTIAPATGMVFIALWMTTYTPGVAGLTVIAATTAVVILVALCIAHFTRRLAASGSLYSFVHQGLGARVTLTTGIALLLGYLGISISVMSQAADSLLALAASLGVPVLGMSLPGVGTPLVTVALVAVAVAVIAVRGVLFATRAILVVEGCSLVLLVALMAGTPAESAAPTVARPDAPLGILVLLAMLTVLSMAGFESAAFFGPEARRPLVTVTRTVLVTPVVVGALFVFAAWAALSGRGSIVVGAYFDGTASGADPRVVIAVQIAMTCSWFASTLGCAQAGSRLLYSMGVERILPRPLARVHPRLRTPHVAVAVFGGASLIGAGLRAATGAAHHDTFHSVVEIGLIVAYTLVAVASLRFLTRIGEDSPATRVGALVATALGVGLLGYIVIDAIGRGSWTAPIVLVAVAVSGSAWLYVLRRIRPGSLATIGAFDSVETTDILPGAGQLVIGADGRRHILPVEHRPGSGAPA